MNEQAAVRLEWHEQAAAQCNPKFSQHHLVGHLEQTLTSEQQPTCVLLLLQQLPDEGDRGAGEL